MMKNEPLTLYIYVDNIGAGVAGKQNIKHCPDFRKN